MPSASEKIAVVLFNMGGPDSLDAVEPFLFNLFRDPDIIQIPTWMLGPVIQRPLARFISGKRAPKVAKLYEEIGGKSPIKEITEAQAAALEDRLNERFPDRFRCLVAMRYWKPFTEDALRTIRHEGITRVLLLSLYPHYARATTASSLNEWMRLQEEAGMELDVDVVCSYSGNDRYADFLAARIDEKYEKLREELADDEIGIMFSAHGLPQRYVNEGDPYRWQIERTARLAMERVNKPYMVCFQSQVGPEQWLKPSTEDAMEHYAKLGKKGLIVVPVAFVSEHVETLHEIGIEFREVAEELGIHHFERVETPNDHPEFISVLEDLVYDVLEKPQCAMRCDAPDQFCCGKNSGKQGAAHVNTWLSSKPRVLPAPETITEEANV